VAKNSMSQFINAISKGGGMSMSNGYDVDFELPAGLNNYIKNTTKIDINNSNTSDSSSLITLLCDEASLPSIQASTGQINGMHMGEASVNYPHSKMYTDFNLSWMCDADMTPLKFINAWYNYIFNGNINEEIKTLERNRLESVKQQKANLINRAIRLKFPVEYMAPTVRITKTERGKNAPNSRAPVSYIMQECYPYSIDAVPLSYGSSQITKVSANFYYRKYTLVYNNIKGYQG
jgi:hypothetical protein